MIVTGELMRDPARNKFIPLIRQNTSEPTVPRCVSTKNWINLNDGPDFEEEFERLLRHLHNAPKLRKPPIGHSPYTSESFSGEASLARQEGRKLDFTEALSRPETAYDFSLEIIRADNRVAWRRLLRASLERCGTYEEVDE
jgi:hypothetical protein